MLRLNVGTTRFRFGAVVVHRGRSGVEGYYVGHVRVLQQWRYYDDRRRLARISLPRDGREDGVAFVFASDDVFGSPTASFVPVGPISQTRSFVTEQFAAESAQDSPLASANFVPDRDARASPPLADVEADVEVIDGRCWEAMDSLSSSLPTPAKFSPPGQTSASAISVSCPATRSVSARGDARLVSAPVNSRAQPDAPLLTGGDAAASDKSASAALPRATLPGTRPGG